MLDRWEGPAVIATGAVWPRDALAGLPLHKVDMRVTKRVKMVNNVQRRAAGRGVQRVQLEELRQLQHHDHVGRRSASRVANSGNAYVPREGQLGVRVEF